MLTNLECRERQRKRESRRQASKAQREKERQTVRARDKFVKNFVKTKETFLLLKEQQENFVAAVLKIRNASGHQCENERQSE